jgi:inhibitor of KinA sporulation pathway (predicted exonuclease)
MRKVDKLVIIDIECTCWSQEPGKDRSQLPRREESEIIEVGVCTLDLKTLEPEDVDGIIVIPVTSTVSDFCTELTTLTQADVDRGIPLMDACQILRKKYDSKNRVWASYGQYDKNMFEKECLNKHINYPFGGLHINIKGVVETIYGESLGMARALDKMKIELEGRHHRGISDAWNIGRMYAAILCKMRRK